MSETPENLLLSCSGQAHRQEEEDKREELQLEPLLERVICLYHWRDGYEEGHARDDGMNIFFQTNSYAEKENIDLPFGQT